MNDAFETKAIKLAMGDAAYQCKVNSTKSMVGHLLGAAAVSYTHLVKCLHVTQETLTLPDLLLQLQQSLTS